MRRSSHISQDHKYTKVHTPEIRYDSETTYTTRLTNFYKNMLSRWIHGQETYLKSFSQVGHNSKNNFSNFLLDLF